MFWSRLLKSILVFVFPIVALIPNVVFADSDRVTKGDVEAIFNAFPTGGRTIWWQSNGSAIFYAAPFDADFTASIRPLPPWDGTRFCVDDWHVILIADFDGGDQSFTREDAEGYLSAVNLTFTLDGETLSTVRTPITRMLEPETLPPTGYYDEAYGFQEGRIFSPSELSPGEHFLNLHYYHPVFGEFDSPITFFIDPSDSLTCTQ